MYHMIHHKHRMVTFQTKALAVEVLIIPMQEVATLRTDIKIEKGLLVRAKITQDTHQTVELDSLVSIHIPSLEADPTPD